VEVNVSHLDPTAALSIDRSTGVSPALSPVVKRAQRFISSHIGEPLPLAKIAQVARCSRRHLCERFPLETGETVGAYVRRVRLHVAANEIRAGVKIMAVARSVGYHSYSNFVRLFRQAFGTAPHEFRSAAARPELGCGGRTAPGSHG
jgi:transcriptional regulator GlxA family with amidase domain